MFMDLLSLFCYRAFLLFFQLSCVVRSVFLLWIFFLLFVAMVFSSVLIRSPDKNSVKRTDARKTVQFLSQFLLGLWFDPRHCRIEWTPRYSRVWGWDGKKIHCGSVFHWCYQWETIFSRFREFGATCWGRELEMIWISFSDIFLLGWISLPSFCRSWICLLHAVHRSSWRWFIWTDSHENIRRSLWILSESISELRLEDFFKMLI